MTKSTGDKKSNSKIKVTTIDESFFSDNYERKKRLHSDLAGPHCQIYQCLHKPTGNTRSIRVVPKAHYSQDRFLRGVKILKELNGHPNLPDIHDIYEMPNFYLIVMDDLSHPTVAQALEEIHAGGTATAKEVKTIVHVLLNALEYLHNPSNKSKQDKIGIVHGKIHPDNILVPRGRSLDNLMLVNFSSAQMFTDKENDAATIHTEATEPLTDSDEDSENEQAPGSALKQGKKKQKKSVWCPPEYSTEVGPTPEGDMWALGILTFLLLTGKFPFAKPSETRQPIAEWYGIKDANCRTFIQLLLCPQPEHRPSARSINQKCPCWHQMETSEGDYDFTQVMHRLATINREHELQMAVRSYLAANFLPQLDQDRLRQVFRQADTKNNNTLNRREFEIALQKASLEFLDGPAIDAAFDKLDVDNDHRISYAEFMAFAHQSDVLLEKDKLRAAFDAMDWSSTNYITPQDLKHFSHSAGGAAAFRRKKALRRGTINSLIQKADTNRDGKISFDEFVDMMVGLERSYEKYTYDPRAQAAQDVEDYYLEKGKFC